MTPLASRGAATPTMAHFHIERAGRLRYSVPLLARSKPRRW